MFEAGSYYAPAPDGTCVSSEQAARAPKSRVYMARGEETLAADVVDAV